MRRTCEEDRLLFSLEEAKDDDVIERDRLRSRPRLVRARALLAAVVSGDGDSPNMKNLINAPMMITTESWPRRKPSVNDNLRLFSCLALSRQIYSQPTQRIEELAKAHWGRHCQPCEDHGGQKMEVICSTEIIVE